MLMSEMPDNLALQEVAPEFLQRTVCHALAVGNEAGKPPYLGLLQVAEALAGNKPLKDIPLMFAIAEVSVAAALERGISHDH